MRLDAPFNTQALAYLGDAVFELCVRAMLAEKGGKPAGEMNRDAKRYVSAKAQAAMYHRLYGYLTAEEQAVMRRGRNLNPASRAKNAGLAEYRHATGLEALFGYLYTEGRQTRLEEVFSICAKPSDGAKN